MTPKENPIMDRFDPDNFDSLAHERRATVRGLEIEHFPGGKNPDARGHDFRLGFDVGPNTRYAISANAAELRRWSMTLAETALRADDHPEDGPTCPACRGDVHVDLAGAVWTTSRYASDEDLRRAAIAACKAVWEEAHGGDFEEDCPAKEKWIAEELTALRPALAALGINTAAAS